MLLLSFLQAFVLLGSALAQLDQPAVYLNVSAITGCNGESVFECWSVGPFATSSVSGLSGASTLFMGETANATYTVVPPRFDGGLHTAPAVQ
jgi:hypothetical protein